MPARGVNIRATSGETLLHLTLDAADLGPAGTAGAAGASLFGDAWPWVALVFAIVLPLSAGWLGARLAQRATDRHRLRDELEREVRATNVALAWTHAICNSAMALKRQHVTATKTEFDRAREECAAYLRKRRTGELQGNKAYALEVSLRTLMPPRLPTSTLRMLAQERLALAGRALGLAVVLDEVATTLREAIATRNEQLRAFRDAGNLEKPTSALKYLGFPYDGGHVDETCMNTLQAIVTSVDDTIFFSWSLAEDLQAHGRTLVSRHTRAFGRRDPPAITRLDFSQALADNTIPTAERYADWTIPFADAPRFLR